MLPISRSPRRFAAPAPILTVLAVLSCGGASSGDAGGGGADAPGGDGAAIAGTPSACPQTLAEVCAQPDPAVGYFGTHCASTLAAAERDPALCIGISLGGTKESRCGAYNVITETNIDLSYLYYYDASGALIAIVAAGVAEKQCLGGAGTFVVPAASSCGADAPLPACQALDAGASD